MSASLPCLVHARTLRSPGLAAPALSQDEAYRAIADCLTAMVLRLDTGISALQGDPADTAVALEVISSVREDAMRAVEAYRSISVPFDPEVTFRAA